jgi:hypothetical protein
MATRSTGLRWERIAEAIGEFVRRHGASTPRRAVLCTYDFDPERFQAVLFPVLTRRGRQFRTLVMADAGALQQRLRERSRQAFDRYELAPVRCNRRGVFHPKIFLLRAGDNYLVGIGSSNLTAGGFGANLEFMFFADQTRPEGDELLHGVASFLQRLLASKNVVLPTSANRFVKLALAGILPKANIVLDTLESPLLPQMVKIHHRACGQLADTLTVISPWHSSGRTPDGTDPRVIRELRQNFALRSQIRVFTQGQGGNGPDLGDGVQVMITREDAATSDDDPVENTHNHRPAELHAKGYLVRGARASTFFFGSANCTQPALMSSVGGQGNVEALVATKLSSPAASALCNDLEQLFTGAVKLCPAKTPQAPSRPRGLILAGYVKPKAERTILQLEVPGEKRNTTTIAARSGPTAGQMVQLIVRNGSGIVDEARDLKRLFPEEIPHREMEAWSTMLWEKAGSVWLPFPVSVPLAEPASGLPADALNEILEEECGMWPKTRRAAGEDNDVQDDNDLSEGDEIADVERTLTEAKHQGELDRIAVAAALLRRRITRRFESKKHRRIYFRQLQERLDGISLAPHLRLLLQKFFREMPFTEENR